MKEVLEDIESRLASLPLFKLQPVKEFIVLDGYLTYPSGKKVLGRTYLTERYPVVVLSAFSDTENIIHETLHANGIYNEAVVRPLAKLLDYRIRFVAPSKSVQYREERSSLDQLLRQYKIALEIARAEPYVNKYVIVGGV